MPAPVNRGAVVAIKLAGILHPSVVLHIEGDYVVVLAAGSSQSYPELESVRIEPCTRSGKSMRLSKTTYFYGRGIKTVHRRELLDWEGGGGRCPDYEIAKLAQLMDKTLSRRKADARSEPLPIQRQELEDAASGKG